jgi:hypothetical protein
MPKKVPKCAKSGPKDIPMLPKEDINAPKIITNGSKEVAFYLHSSVTFSAENVALPCR